MEQPTKPIKFSRETMPICVLLCVNICVLLAICAFPLYAPGASFHGPRWPEHGAAVVGGAVVASLAFLVFAVFAIHRAKADISPGLRVLCVIVLLPGPIPCIVFVACRFPLTVLCVGSIACVVLWLAWIRRRARASADAPSMGSQATSSERPRAPAVMRFIFRVHAWALGISLLFAPALCLLSMPRTGGGWLESDWLIASLVVAIGAGLLAWFLVPVDLLLCIDSLALRIITGKRFSPTLRAACWSLAMALLGAAPLLALFAVHAQVQPAVAQLSCACC